ncbi:MAG: hypothetical protein WBF39_18830 [Planococcus donghaensis]
MRGRQGDTRGKQKICTFQREYARWRENTRGRQGDTRDKPKIRAFQQVSLRNRQNYQKTMKNIYNLPIAHDTIKLVKKSVTSKGM